VVGPPDHGAFDFVVAGEGEQGPKHVAAEPVPPEPEAPRGAQKVEH
jgi:hypothetical protein